MLEIDVKKMLRDFDLQVKLNVARGQTLMLVALLWMLISTSSPSFRFSSPRSLRTFSSYLALITAPTVSPIIS
jgi:hypothetical protein